MRSSFSKRSGKYAIRLLLTSQSSTHILFISIRYVHNSILNVVVCTQQSTFLFKWLSYPTQVRDSRYLGEICSTEYAALRTLFHSSPVLDRDANDYPVCRSGSDMHDDRLPHNDPEPDLLTLGRLLHRLNWNWRRRVHDTLGREPRLHINDQSHHVHWLLCRLFRAHLLPFHVPKKHDHRWQVSETNSMWYKDMTYICDLATWGLLMPFVQGWGRYFWNVSKIQIQIHEGLYLLYLSDT